MLRGKLYYLPLLLLALLSGCTGLPYYTLSSVEPETEYYEEREILTKETDTFISALEFENQNDDYLTFYVHIINKSKDTIQFEPANIYLTALDKNFNTIFENNVRRHYAMGEDHYWREIEKEENGMAFLNLFGSLFSFAAEIGREAFSETIDFSEEEYVEVTNINITNSTGGKIYLNGEEFEEPEYEEENFRNQFLPKTVLYADEEAGGIIFIRKFLSADYFEISIKINDETHTYRYKAVKE